MWPFSYYEYRSSRRLYTDRLSSARSQRGEHQEPGGRQCRRDELNRPDNVREVGVEEETSHYGAYAVAGAEAAAEKGEVGAAPLGGGELRGQRCAGDL